MNENTNVNTSPETQVEGQAQETQVTEPKTFTEEEVQRMIDQRVTQAMQKAERKTAAKVREAEKLAQMNETQKYEYQLQQREAAIAEKERELALMENKNEASKILSEKGLSLALVDFVVAEDADTMDLNIRTLEQAFKQSVKAEVEKRLAGSAPKKNLPLDQPLTPEAFRKMSASELMTLKANNPDLYNTLKNS